MLLDDVEPMTRAEVDRWVAAARARGVEIVDPPPDPGGRSRDEVLAELVATEDAWIETIDVELATRDELR